ncbi:MAG: peptidylprolyl isomerase [bacterium]|nr:peptidylprolyl isomerase [bacterium]
MKRFLILALTSLLILSGCKPSQNAVDLNKEKTQEEVTQTKEVDLSKDKLALFVWQSQNGENEDTMVIRFYPEKALNHVKNFVTLAEKKFYNGLVIFRVEPNFVIQTGSPDNTNMGGPGYNVNAEFNDIKHLKGTVAMARSQDPNSAGSQFYICLGATPHLDGKYTVFGQVIEKTDVLDRIKKGDYMREVKIVDAEEYYGADYKKIIEEKDIH